MKMEDLTVNELRERRANALKKRKYQQWMHICFACFMTAIMVFCIVYFSNHVNANDFEEQRTKYYTGIEIKEGDSLWGIAETYMSKEYDSIQDYIEELKQINQLKSDKIYVGKYLIVSYYK